MKVKIAESARLLSLKTLPLTPQRCCIDEISRLKSHTSILPSSSIKHF